MRRRTRIAHRRRSFLEERGSQVDILGLNIKSDRGTWPYDIAATYFGKVRTPCDGG